MKTTDQTQDMRTRYACDQCSFKATSEIVLKTHKIMHHERKVEKKVSKRINCDYCEKRFNKKETFNQHMKKDHQAIIMNNYGRSK